MVERHLAKVNVASSNLVFRSRKNLVRLNEVFSTESVLRRNKSTAWMKSANADEIALWRIKDGFH